MKRKITSLALAVLLIISLLPLSGCGGITTLNKIGRTLEPLTRGFETELDLLLASKLITQAKYDAIKRLGLVGKAKIVGDYLTNLTIITAGNKQEVINQIQGAIDLFQKVVGVAQPGSTAAKVLAVITLGLASARIAVDLLSPPPRAVGQAAGMPEKGIPTSSVKVTAPHVPPEVRKYLKGVN